jgi:hypothetical protein
MVLALITIVLGLFHVIPDTYYKEHNLTFWMETVAVEAFGLSWLVKAEVILKDKPQHLATFITETLAQSEMV